MMNEAKIRLSPEETELVRNAEIILTKNAVMLKMQGFLSEIQSEHSALLTSYSSLPQEILRNSPKISRGENYLGLPYLVLDQPRHFELNNIFAIRILFWWGRSFIITLHLSGKYKTLYEAAIFNAAKELATRDFLFCINEDEWKHHLADDNYKPFSNTKEFINISSERSFLKIAKSIGLDDMDALPEEITKTYAEILDLLTGSSKDGLKLKV